MGSADKTNGVVIAATVMAACVGALLVGPLSVEAHESPIDHVDRTLRLSYEDGKLTLTYRLRQTQRAALMQFRAIDRNGDGRISDEEHGHFFRNHAGRLAKSIQIEVEGKNVTLQPTGKVRLGADFSQTYRFAGETDRLAKGSHRGRLRDLFSRRYPGSFRYAQPIPTVERPTVAAQGDPSMVDMHGHPDMLRINFTIRVP